MTIRHRWAGKGLGLVLAGSMLLAACGASGSSDDAAKAAPTPTGGDSCLADAPGSGGGTPSAVTEDPIPKDVQDQTGTITVSGKALPQLESDDGRADPAFYSMDYNGVVNSYNMMISMARMPAFGR